MMSCYKLTAVLAAAFFLSCASAFQVSPSSSSSSRSIVQRIPSSSRLYSEATAETFDLYDITNIGQSLEWKDIKVGDGPEIQKDDLITVRHVGTVMQSGMSLGEHEFQFQYLEPGRVMPGWSQGMQGMKVGGRRVLRIPPRLGYGNRAVGSSIPANSHLEFDVEILSKDDSLWSLFLYKTGFKADVRTAGILVCLGYLALSPMLESKLNNLF